MGWSEEMAKLEQEFDLDYDELSKQTVCLTHFRFIPCRREGKAYLERGRYHDPRPCRHSEATADVELVRRYQAYTGTEDD